MSQNLVVFDIDGVLFDPKDRINHFVRGEYEEYIALAHTDKPIWQGIEVCKHFVGGGLYKTLFVTARWDHGSHRDQTLSMLRKYISPSIPSSALLMRMDYDSKDDIRVPDEVSKPNLIEQAGYSLDDIFLVFEDRTHIVEMWRSRGVTCYQTQDF